MRTLQGRLDWTVEVYPFKVADPVDAIGSDIGASLGTLEPEVFTTEASPGKKSIAKGIRSISVSRDKNSPNGVCDITLQGPCPRSAVNGSWVVVSTAIGSNAVPRFVGQIYASETSYMTQKSGLVSLKTTLKVREWSSALTMTVRFNPTSILAALREKTPDATAVGQLLTAVSVAQNKNITSEKLSELFTELFSPYQFAQVALQLVGACSSLDLSPNVESFKLAPYAEIATSMPAVPKALLDRFNVDPSVSPNNPFSPEGKRGFVDLISGYQNEPVLASGTWDGAFPEGGIEAYKKTFVKDDKAKPRSVGTTALSQMEFRAWDLITKWTEPTVNETFTDFYYEKATVNNEQILTARPVIVVRNKPYLIEELENLAETKLGVEPLKQDWARYEDVPRVFIDDAAIVGMRIHSTFINSFNYILPKITPALTSQKLATAQAAAMGAVDLKPFQRRWGGIPDYSEFSYLGGQYLQDYIKEVKMLMACWHAFNYRMASGMLILKPTKALISLGMNVQFKFGDRILLGQVEAIDMQMTVTDAGNVESQMMVRLDRIVKVVEGELKTFAMGEINAMSGL